MEYGTPPDPGVCADLGTLPMALNTPQHAPEQLAGKPIPDTARIREAVFLMQKKPGSHRAEIRLKSGPATIYVGPKGWRVARA